ncbi:MAG: GAF domain-containing protein [Caulobacter sp.]|nr:GAF domain-containing protein [Caulobacter sp.]
MKVGADRQDAPLFTLVETIEQLSFARRIEDVAAVVRTRAREISGADGVTFVLRDGAFCHYLDEDAVGPLWKGRKFPLEACISGWAMLNGETAVVPDIYLDDRIPHDAYRPTFVKSLVMTPVRPNDPIAAIGAYWSDIREPSAHEVAALQAMARATATALENVRLLASLNHVIHELDHRVKNTLAAALSVANHTLKATPSPAAFTESFNGRLMALSRAHELLGRDDWRGGDLADVLASAASAEGGERVSLKGPKIRLGPETAVSFMVVFHELFDNARRHGALSRPEGRVSIDWRVDGPDFELTWLEHRGPPVSVPVRRGFGSQLIERGLPRDVSGQGRMVFEPDGLRYVLTAPLSDRVALA